jgi:hypothetical protein
LKALQKIARSRCEDLGRRYHCSIIEMDPRSLLITKMGRNLTNKTMVAQLTIFMGIVNHYSWR